jgi:hypothetical protein
VFEQKESIAGRTAAAFLDQPRLQLQRRAVVDAAEALNLKRPC